MNKRNNIKSGNIRTVLALFIFVMLFSSAKSQTEISMQGLTTCVSSEAVIPVHVKEFNDISAFTIFINCDTADIELVEVNNLNAELESGFIEANLSQTENAIVIGWYSMTPANINDAKLFDISLILTGETADLDFSTSSEIVLSDLTILENISYTNCEIISYSSLAPLQPSETVDAGSSTTLEITEIDGISYQWQENSGLSWTNITDNDHFSGSQTNHLAISDVPYSFNDNFYRCKLISEYCNDYTTELHLEVIPVGVDEHLTADAFELTVYPNPANSEITLIYNKGMLKDIGYSKIQFFDVIGNHVYESPGIKSPDMDGLQTVSVDDLKPGIYILQFFVENHLLATEKIVINK